VKSNFSKETNHLQSKFTIIHPKNEKKSRYVDYLADLA
jgi:hypothetical protein